MYSPESPLLLLRKTPDRTMILNQYASSADLTTGLVGWWKLDEGTGTSAIDSGSGGRAGAIHGATYVTGQIGSGLHFDGTDDVDFGTTLNFGATDSFTVALWCQFTSLAGNYPSLVGKSASDNGWGYLVALDSGTGKIITQITDGSGTTASYFTAGAVNSGTWRHVAMVIDRGAQLMLVYIDGALDNSVSTAAVGDLTQSAPLYLGVRQDSVGPRNRYTGDLDEARIYTRALSAPEIAALYAYR